MDYGALDKILTETKKFHATDGTIWHFSDTTITIDGEQVTQYLLYIERDTGTFVIMTTKPLEVAEDYFVTVKGDKGSYILTLTPRFSKQKIVVLKESVSSK